MPGVDTAEMTTPAAPESGRNINQEARRGSELALFKESKRRLRNPEGLTDAQRGVLEFGVSILTAKDPRRDNIDKKAAGEPGTDLLMRASPPEAMGGDGKPVSWAAGEVRIASIRGLDPDDPNNIMVTFKKVADDSDFLDTSGGVYVAPLPRDEFFEVQLAAEPIYDEIITGQSKDVVAAELQVLRHERGKAALPTRQPTESDIAALETDYPQDALEDEEEEPRTPLERADRVIANQIKVLEAALTKNPPDAEYESKDKRAMAQALLFKLKVAAAAAGPAGVLVKTYALQQMQDSQFPLGDFVGEIADLATEEMDANQMLKIHIEELIHNPDSGIKDDKEIQELLTLLEEKGIIEFLQNKKVQKLAENTDIVKDIMGESFSTDQLIDFIKASQLSPELKAALEEGAKTGRIKKDKLLLAFLIALGIPLVAAVGGALAAPELVEMMSKMSR